MKVRIAFAVISQLEEPIILVDEVLAVGDKAFREKCYRRIEELLAGGRTLFFVSHNERDLRRFCTRGLYLDKGALVLDAPIDEVLDRYNADHGTGSASRRIPHPVSRASLPRHPAFGRIRRLGSTHGGSACTRSPRWAPTPPQEGEQGAPGAGPARPGPVPLLHRRRRPRPRRGARHRPVLVDPASDRAGAPARHPPQVPNATPEQLVRILERRYLAAVTTAARRSAPRR